MRLCFTLLSSPFRKWKRSSDPSSLSLAKSYALFYSPPIQRVGCVQLRALLTNERTNERPLRERERSTREKLDRRSHVHKRVSRLVGPRTPRPRHRWCRCNEFSQRSRKVFVGLNKRERERERDGCGGRDPNVALSYKRSYQQSSLLLQAAETARQKGKRETSQDSGELLTVSAGWQLRSGIFSATRNKQRTNRVRRKS